MRGRAPYRVSFGGGMKSFGVSKTKGGGVGFDRDDVGERLEGIRRRLNKVVVENLPYERCLQNYDAASTFFFLDPPYVGGPTGAYDGFSQEDMSVLRGRLAAHRQRFAGQPPAVLRLQRAGDGHTQSPPEQPDHHRRHVRRTHHHP